MLRLCVSVFRSNHTDLIEVFEFSFEMWTAWPHLFHAGPQSNPQHRTLFDGHYTCLMDLQELICLKQLFQDDFLCEVSSQTAEIICSLPCRLTEGHVKTTNFSAATNEDGEGKTEGSHLLTSCACRGGGDQPISFQWGKTISKMKEKHV